jgi:hypothetical protein
MFGFLKKLVNLADRHRKPKVAPEAKKKPKGDPGKQYTREQAKRRRRNRARNKRARKSRRINRKR